jgi:hypothetical protein
MKLPKFLQVFKHFSYLHPKTNSQEQTPQTSPLEKFAPKEEEDVHQYKQTSTGIKRLGAPADTESIEEIEKKKNKKYKRNTIKLLL